MARVALLWHMHQPYYEDLVTREHILPWVRLHALKDYYGMVALMKEFPRVRATFNLVPSLLVQIEAFAEGRAHDPYLEMGLAHAETLSPDAVAFILRNFFHAQRSRMIDIHPRYAELLALRAGTSPADIAAAARRFTPADLRDLQVWQKLAWMDPDVQLSDGRVHALVLKGEGFTEEDKQVLRAAELDLLRAVIPAYRDRAEAGQIEIATSPFYHPILPLLCDTDIYRRTHPHSEMPRHRFQHPEDAREQLDRAAAYHERLFGRRPVGLWPSEGSVSDAIVPLAADGGFEWLATDELILSRTLGTFFERDGAGFVDRPNDLYAPYRLNAGGRAIACAFRDHVLSDLIGFTYASWPADRAADDFVTRLAEAARRAERAGLADPVVFVILDGENAWEHFEGGGRPFLRAVYGRLSDHPTLRTVTMHEACHRPERSLQGIFPGSWIDANFYIWIGHEEDRRGWDQLSEAREALSAPSDVDPASAARAREEILIAEGSDWFWWYGDDHSSDHDAEFDDLFRRHLRNVYRLLNKPVPEELFATNIRVGAAASGPIEPTGLLAPVVDGEESSYFEWLGAGRVEIRDTFGAMHQSDRPPSKLTCIHAGFDDSHLYIRLDTRQPARQLVAQGHSFWLTFLTPEGCRLRTDFADGRLEALLDARTPDGWARRETQARVAAGSVLELAVPLADLGPARPTRLAFFVSLHGTAAEETERHPTGRAVELTVPAGSVAFNAGNWSA
jgi:alpha-amylase/alpha-mannosidase (GH57 family)